MSRRFLGLVRLTSMLLDHLRILGWIQVDSSGKYHLSPQLAKQLKDQIPDLVMNSSTSIVRYNCRSLLELSAERMLKTALLGEDLDEIHRSGFRMLAGILANLVLIECGNCPNSSKSYSDREDYLRSMRNSGCVQEEMGYV